MTHFQATQPELLLHPRPMHASADWLLQRCPIPAWCLLPNSHPCPQKRRLNPNAHFSMGIHRPDQARRWQSVLPMAQQILNGSPLWTYLNNKSYLFDPLFEEPCEWNRHISLSTGLRNKTFNMLMLAKIRIMFYQSLVTPCHFLSYVKTRVQSRVWVQVWNLTSKTGRETANSVEMIQHKCSNYKTRTTHTNKSEWIE